MTAFVRVSTPHGPRVFATSAIIEARPDVCGDVVQTELVVRRTMTLDTVTVLEPFEAFAARLLEPAAPSVIAPDSTVILRAAVSARQIDRARVCADLEAVGLRPVIVDPDFEVVAAVPPEPSHE